MRAAAAAARLPAACLGNPCVAYAIAKSNAHFIHSTLGPHPATVRRPLNVCSVRVCVSTYSSIVRVCGYACPRLRMDKPFVYQPHIERARVPLQQIEHITLHTHTHKVHHSGQSARAQRITSNANALSHSANTRTPVSASASSPTHFPPDSA